MVNKLPNYNIDYCLLPIDGIYNMKDYCLECTLNDGKIIIHYPEYFNGKNKSVSVIGSLDEENTFITEYIIMTRL